MNAGKRMRGVRFLYAAVCGRKFEKKGDYGMSIYDLTA